MSSPFYASEKIPILHSWYLIWFNYSHSSWRSELVYTSPPTVPLPDLLFKLQPFLLHDNRVSNLKPFCVLWLMSLYLLQLSVLDLFTQTFCLKLLSVLSTTQIFISSFYPIMLEEFPFLLYCVCVFLMKHYFIETLSEFVQLLTQVSDKRQNEIK